MKLDLSEEGFSLNTIEVLKKRYLLRDGEHRVIETPEALFRRVAHCVAKAERNFVTRNRLKEIEEKFFQMMYNLEFMPNSPTLMNADTPLGQLSACFVLPIEDSIEGIFRSLKEMAKIHQSGGGTGFDFSSLRPKGDLVSSTKGYASGPVSFMSIFDKATDVIVQGGRRRGANMGILRCDHPDIVDFVKAKRKRTAFENFNLSVAATDNFMESVIKNRKISFVNPRTGKKTGSTMARYIFDIIVSCAWRTGDPGLVFIDEINRKHSLEGLGEVCATNPCGEQPLLPYESCNLGSINLARFVRMDRKVDWERLGDTVRWAIRFLDNVIEVNKFPLAAIKKVTMANRKIGLGVMGFADMLILMDIPYNSKRAVGFAEKLMSFIHKESISASVQLAKERGVFPNFKNSRYAKKNIKLRNATVNTIAPTGSISIIAGCSSGIEPLFSVCFIRNILDGTRLFEINPLFEKMLRKRGIFNKDLVSKVARYGSVQNIKEVPKSLREIFITAFDIPPKQHLLIQAAFQRYTDNSVSKTINLPRSATVADVRDIYLTAYRFKCKGITVYRYGSKKGQVLSLGGWDKDNRKTGISGPVVVSSEYSGGCVSGPCNF